MLEKARGLGQGPGIPLGEDSLDHVLIGTKREARLVKYAGSVGHVGPLAQYDAGAGTVKPAPRGEHIIPPDVPPSLGEAILVGVQGDLHFGADGHREAEAQASNEFIPGRDQHFGPQPEWDSLGLKVGRRSGAAPVLSAFLAVCYLAAEHFPANQAEGHHRFDAGAIRAVAGIEDTRSFARDRIDELGVSFTVVGWPGQRDVDALNEIVGMLVTKGLAVANLLGRVVGGLVKHIVSGLVQQGRVMGAIRASSQGGAAARAGNLQAQAC